MSATGPSLDSSVETLVFSLVGGGGLREAGERAIHMGGDSETHRYSDVPEHEVSGGSLVSPCHLAECNVGAGTIDEGVWHHLFQGGGGGGHDERKVPLDLKKGRVKKEDRCSSSKSWDEGYEERSVVSRRKYELRKFADQGLGEVESPPRAWNGPTAPTGSQTSP
jgi:hypothetical protein